MLSRTEKYLKIIQDRGQKKRPLKRVYSNIVKDNGLFLMGYGRLYAKKGAGTAGVINDTVDGMNLKRIDRIREQLRTRTYEWTPVKRQDIRKGPGKTRALGLPIWSDKLVQEAIRVVLNAYYEPQFSEYSFGYRPNRGCHSALLEIHRKWRGVKWFIEGDIKGCFDNINHKVLLSILRRQIKDKTLIDLIKGMLEAGYMAFGIHHKTYSGTPQGGVLSPLLANVVLNELDQFIEREILPRYNQGRRQPNPEYVRINTALHRARRRGDREMAAELEKLRYKMPSMLTEDPDYCRVRYVRYSDDFLLGVTGPKKVAVAVKTQVGEFLARIKLPLSDEKTLITHARTQKARFLGYDINVIWNDSYRGKSVAGYKRRARNGGIGLSVPEDVTRKWIRKCTRGQKIVHRGELINLSDAEIIATYGAEFRGLYNYYQMAHNVSQELYRIKYFYQQSLLKTLAAKHKSTRKAMAIKYKRKTDKGVTAIMRVVPNPKDPDKPHRYEFGNFQIRYNPTVNYIVKDEIETALKFGRNELVRRTLANTCELCGKCDIPVEIHHIKALKEIKGRYKGKKNPPPEWAKFMMARNRKTVVIGELCHTDIHRGKYDNRCSYDKLLETDEIEQL